MTYTILIVHSVLQLPSQLLEILYRLYVRRRPSRVLTAKVRALRRDEAASFVALSQGS